MTKNILDNIMDIKEFIKTIIHYQELYWKIEDSIKPCDRENPISAKEIEAAYSQMNYIAEQLARFILNRNTRVNIFNADQIEFNEKIKNMNKKTVSEERTRMF